MMEKKRIFLLNDEQKILVFLTNSEKRVPKIILPSLYTNGLYINENKEFKHLTFLLSSNLEDYEFINDFEARKEYKKCENGKLKNAFYITKYKYYAMKLILTDEIKETILRICEEEDFIADFLSIEEIINALLYIRETNEKSMGDVKLERALHALRRKMYYEEY